MGIFKAHFMKIIKSPLFYIGIILTAAVIGSDHYVAEGAIHDHVVNDVVISLGFSNTRGLIAVCGALPFAANFAKEWTSGVTASCVTRCGEKKYIVSNVVMCYVSTVLTVFLGIMLYAFVLSFFLPVFEMDNNYMDVVTAYFVELGAPWLQIMYQVFIYSVSCAMYSVMGMTLTAFFPNKYVGMCGPFVASYVIERFSFQISGHTPWFNLFYASMAQAYESWGVWFRFFYFFGLMTAIAAVFSVVFGIVVRRRIRNEIV